ncbi:MAG TPA: hypothetical protein VN154_05935 [Rhizomicrobium sp.]|nr:hypothetical protein [Rhizomicrobium sp.]
MIDAGRGAILTKRNGSPRLRCRQIVEEDKEAIVDLLTEGFDRPREFWVEVFAKLSARDTPKGLPRYGYTLEADGTLVGVLLLIFAFLEDAVSIRCNVSSWYVKPEFRTYASMLVSRALHYREATYFNLTPAPATVPILKALGYMELSGGKFYSFPVLHKPMQGARIQVVSDRAAFGLDISRFEAELMRSHAAFGCLSLVCRTKDGAYPFVFSRRRVGRYFRGALLIYCRNTADFIPCAGTLGRFLAKRGILSIILHANGPIPGLLGWFAKRSPTFYRGTQPPPLGDLAFSECAMFGV